MNKKTIIIALSAFAALIIFLLIGKSAGFIGKKFKEKVTAEAATLRTIIETITANGKINPEVEVKITSDVSGEIIVLNVKEGDWVVKGQMLAKVQPDIYERNLERMEASVKSASANMEQAKAQFNQKTLSFNRSKTLWEQKTISESDFEMAQVEYNVAKSALDASMASLSSQQAALNEARDQLTKTTIYAPMDGIVTKLNIEKGERVVGTGQFEGTAIMTVSNLKQMEVVVDVNENDIVKVAAGDSCLIEVDAYLKTKFRGVVTQVANSAKNTGVSADQITNFEVKVLILPESYAGLISRGKENEYPFRPGMSATVDIQTETKANVITIPVQSVAIRTDSVKHDSLKVTTKPVDQELRKEVVFVVNNGKIEQRDVKPGIQDSRYIEIISGLKQDEQVVSGPYSAISRKLSDGMEVEVVKSLYVSTETKK
jgi:HlyD family secretion protein